MENFLQPSDLTKPPEVQTRAIQLFEQGQTLLCATVDHLFAGLLVVEWLASIVVALVISPRAWEGYGNVIHVHVYAAIFLGGAIVMFPVALAWFRPGTVLTRQVVGAAQMLIGILLIHLTGGRVETHFYIFGSLAFLCSYQDWKVLVSASAIVAADHVLRGWYWPQSVYGIITPSPWRWLEHAGWVVYEDIFLIAAVFFSRKSLARSAMQHAELEWTKAGIEDTVAKRTEELRQSTEQAKALAVAAQAADRAKSEFLANMSHEMRTPLNGVLGLASLLEEAELNQEEKEWVVSIQQCGSSLLGTIDKVLELSRLEAGQMQSVARPFDISQIMEEAIQPMRDTATGKGIELKGIVSPGVETRLVGDPGNLRQILANLVDNAVKFTSQGSVTVLVDNAGWDWQKQHLRISVQDTGIGIKEEFRQMLFRPFVQGDGKSTRKYGGIGLGLTICSRLILLMGGSLEVTSHEGSGSTFTICLDLPVQQELESLVVGGA